MALRRLHRDCAALLDELDIPVPFDVRELCRRLAVDRGRRMHLVPIALPSNGPCGAWLSVNDTDYILYEERTSPLHQLHIIMHEIGHIVCRHEATPLLDHETAMVLMPSLDPNMIARVLGRTSYPVHDEQQAEMIASLILQRASRWSPEPDRADTPEVAGIVDRLELALGRRPRGRWHG
jgi:hypothetical protein